MHKDLFEPRRRILFLTFVWVLIAWGAGLGCGGGGNSTVQGQGNTQSSQISLHAAIASSVPEGKGNATCSITCEVSYTAGTNNVIKFQKTLSALQMVCLNEVPATGQSVDQAIPFQSDDPDVLEGGTVEVSCGPSGASFVDTLTFAFFTDSFDFNAQDCLRDASKCNVSLELSSLQDSINQTGLLPLLSSLKCPTLNLFHSSCTTPSTFCTTLEFVMGVASCDIQAAQPVCGNGTAEEGEECGEATLPSCAPGKNCQNCKCVGTPGVCGDGVVGGKELCDVGGGAKDQCETGFCIGSICRCCGDGKCDSLQGENSDNCLTDCPIPKEICNNGLDDDNDGLTDCADTGDCCSDIACEGSVLCCGDHIVESWEDCDDGNTLDGDGCSSTCHAVCGDGFITSPKENCDTGSKDKGDTLCQTQFGSKAFAGPPSCNLNCVCQGYCGDGVCNDKEGETLETCYADCHTCNDGICDLRFDSLTDETCTDCKGDNTPPLTCLNPTICDTGENINNCYTDCKSCGDGICDLIGGPRGKKGSPTSPDIGCYLDCHRCGDGICDADKGETKANCPQDCTDISQLPTCGDGVCDTCAGEDGKNCYTDCWRCGDKICDASKGENTATCFVDCPPDLPIKTSPTTSCNGNGICEDGERRDFCYDCHYCGDGICDLRPGFDPPGCIDCHGMPATCGTGGGCICGETSQNCLQDCSIVGDHICDGVNGETNLNSIDCTCGNGLREPDLEFCDNGFDTTCVDLNGPGYICAQDCKSCIFSGEVLGPPAPAPALAPAPGTP